MKRKLYLLLFSILATLGLTVWRTVIIGNCIEPFNGFFYSEYSLQRILFAAAVMLFIIIISIMCFTDKDYPGSPRCGSRSLAFLNVIYSVMILIEVFIKMRNDKSTWIKIYIALLICLSIFMIYYSISLFTLKKILPIASVIPLIVFIYRLGYIFVESFGIIKTSEISLTIVALIFCVLFFNFFGRYTSKSKFKKTRKLILITGICAVAMLVICSVPTVLAPLVYPNIKARSFPSDNLFLISTAIYIALFLFISFSKKQLYRKYAESQAIQQNDEN